MAAIDTAAPRDHSSMRVIASVHAAVTLGRAFLGGGTGLDCGREKTYWRDTDTRQAEQIVEVGPSQAGRRAGQLARFWAAMRNSALCAQKGAAVR